jgi:hypothetical protein
MEVDVELDHSDRLLSNASIEFSTLLFAAITSCLLSQSGFPLSNVMQRAMVSLFFSSDCEYR